ncbi:MAG: class I SAM-dependent methyltransferase [Armatimonadota bacterium]
MVDVGHHNRDAYEEYDFARFYDWLYSDREDDLVFYTSQAKQYGTPILEVACGTGRVAIPLARLGLEVVGIDLSMHMLEQARNKLAKETDSVRRLVTLVQCNMRAFDLGRTFSAVFVPNASVFHLPDSESIFECFTCLYKHTSPGGVVVIDVVSPHRMANQEIGVERVFKEGVNPATGLFTQEVGEKLFIDKRSQTVRVRHKYIEFAGDTERCFVLDQNYRWLEKNECEDLLRMVGFMDIRIMGDHVGSPYDDGSPRLIAVGRHAE